MSVRFTAHRLRRWLFGRPARSWFGAGGAYWMQPAEPPIWKRHRRARPMPPGWRNVGYTTEED